ncbi:MAG: hypothetical protein AABX70_03090 [Nanoarchaeota archaeon]
MVGLIATMNGSSPLNFGTVDASNLPDLNHALISPLLIIEQSFDRVVPTSLKPILFERYESLQNIPGKTYSARASYAVRIQGATINPTNPGLLAYAVLFKPGDGTGSDSKQYSLEGLTVPEELRSPFHPSSVVPRMKEGIHTEFVWPLLSAIGESGFVGVGSLEEVTVKGNELVVCQTEGVSTDAFQKIARQTSLGGGIKNYPFSPQITVGYEGERRVGDPHATIYPVSKLPSEFPQLMQVALFLALPSENHPLYESCMKLVERKFGE